MWNLSNLSHRFNFSNLSNFHCNVLSIQSNKMTKLNSLLLLSSNKRKDEPFKFIQIKMHKQFQLNWVLSVFSHEMKNEIACCIRATTVRTVCIWIPALGVKFEFAEQLESFWGFLKFLKHLKILTKLHNLHNFKYSEHKLFALLNFMFLNIISMWWCEVMYVERRWQIGLNWKSKTYFKLHAFFFHSQTRIIFQSKIAKNIFFVMFHLIPN